MNKWRYNAGISPGAHCSRLLARRCSWPAAPARLERPSLCLIRCLLPNATGVNGALQRARRAQEVEVVGRNCAMVRVKQRRAAQSVLQVKWSC